MATVIKQSSVVEGQVVEGRAEPWRVHGMLKSYARAYNQVLGEELDERRRCKRFQRVTLVVGLLVVVATAAAWAA